MFTLFNLKPKNVLLEFSSLIKNKYGTSVRFLNIYKGC